MSWLSLEQEHPQYLLLKMVRIRAFVNARVCTHGKETWQDFYVNLDTGFIVKEYRESASTVIDMHSRLVAPAFQELQINGCLGVHYTTFTDPPELFKPSWESLSTFGDTK